MQHLYARALNEFQSRMYSPDVGDQVVAGICHAYLGLVVRLNPELATPSSVMSAMDDIA